MAGDVSAAGGEAVLWRAQALAGADERTVARAMAEARAEEYRGLADAAESALAEPAEDAARTLRRLRRELQKVRRRDYFPPAERDAATRALGRLAASLPDAARTSGTHA